MPSSRRTSLDAMLADLEVLVTTESPSSDKVAVARSADTVADLGNRRLGAKPEMIVFVSVSHVPLRFGEGKSRVLVLGHHDTVWPVGTLGRIPFAVSDGIPTGPGCFDMKAGFVIAIHAIALVAERASATLDGLTLLVTGDEGLGSPTSRTLIEAEAAGCVAALVLGSGGGKWCAEGLPQRRVLLTRS